MADLIFIMGDQLSPSVSSLREARKNRDVVFMCEVAEEATAVKHHRKKLVFLFSAMRHFADALRDDGYTVDYVRLDDPDNTGSFRNELARAIDRHNPERIRLTRPSEYRVLEEAKTWESRCDLPVTLHEDDRFLCTTERFAEWAGGRKRLRMEYFYREMRTHYDILMDDGNPAGGKWNYDSENRKPPKEKLSVPPPFKVSPDTVTQDVMALVSGRFNDHFGDIEPFHFAVTRNDAKAALRNFIRERLAKFGDYQDAMIEGEPWMFHSHISLYLNCGLLLPMECIEAAEAACRAGDAPLNAVEGFIRQILGWREYVRGIYWLKMPDYADENYLNATRPLPDFYWTADTDMNCVRQCVTETKENAYAHHIQRLMVLGNFALIAGIAPREVNEWYWLVYADAFEWVELPNVSGMTLFADGGLLASKPYAAGGNYIRKMSNYCTHCRYDVKDKTGQNACPFNYLYWDFLLRNRKILKDNPRTAMMYRTLDRMKEEAVSGIRSNARRFLEAISRETS